MKGHLVKSRYILYNYIAAVVTEILWCMHDACTLFYYFQLQRSLRLPTILLMPYHQYPYHWSNSIVYFGIDSMYPYIQKLDYSQHPYKYYVHIGSFKPNIVYPINYTYSTLMLPQIPIPYTPTLVYLLFPCLHPSSSLSFYFSAPTDLGSTHRAYISRKREEMLSRTGNNGTREPCGGVTTSKVPEEEGFSIGSPGFFTIRRSRYCIPIHSTSYWWGAPTKSHAATT